MRLIVEEIDGSIYIDVIFKEEEPDSLKNGCVLDSMAVAKLKRYHLSARVGEKWKYTEPPSFLDHHQLE